MKIYKDMIQSSEEWKQIRLGKVTASKFSAVLAKGAGKTRKAYMTTLATEKLTGLQQESYTSGAMEWGKEQEPFARQYYETLNGLKVKQVGFVELNEWVGYSPDSLVGDDGCLEIKCCNSTTHITTILSEKMPSKHKAQVQGGLWVTGRKWCDFISYDPRVKSRPFFSIRIDRDEKYIKELEIQITMFVEELKSMIEKLTVIEF